MKSENIVSDLVRTSKSTDSTILQAITLRTIMREYRGDLDSAEKAQRLRSAHLSPCSSPMFSILEKVGDEMSGSAECTRFYVTMRKGLGGEYLCDILAEDDLDENVQTKKLYCIVGRNLTEFPSVLVHDSELRSILFAADEASTPDLSFLESRALNKQCLDLACKSNGLDLSSIKQILQEFVYVEPTRKGKLLCSIFEVQAWWVNLVVEESAQNTNSSTDFRPRRPVKHKSTTESMTKPSKRMKQSSLTSFFGGKGGG